jgi:hypothetical protein
MIGAVVAPGANSAQRTDAAASSRFVFLSTRELASDCQIAGTSLILCR